MLAEPTIARCKDTVRSKTLKTNRTHNYFGGRSKIRDLEVPYYVDLLLYVLCLFKVECMSNKSPA